MTVREATRAMLVPEAMAAPVVAHTVCSVAIPAQVPHTVANGVTDRVGCTYSVMMAAAGICSAGYADHHNGDHNK